MAGGGAAAAAGFSVDGATIGIGIGSIVVLVALVAAVFLLAPRIRKAWRQRRRTGNEDGPAQPMEARTNEYRWYEDAEQVAADLEARGDDVQRQDHEGLLRVPTVESTYPVGEASRAVAGRSVDADFLLLQEPLHAPRINPLLRDQL